ncbi:hypothetical protein N7340_17790 [Comamonas aquatica]|uniref:hypothetical protein n=1 Tax=Comamonas aquatica TaxID=225991 RepID=UPI00244B53CC|nr:hypothetical protein [Comamonas aquatica]MDH0373593.1 hypothetical protein [Comamonas aquatica]
MKPFNAMKRYGAKIAAAGSALMLSGAAMAQSTGIDAVLDAVSLDGIETKITAFCLIVVAIALVFKGPDLAKRIIRKV